MGSTPEHDDLVTGVEAGSDPELIDIEHGDADLYDVHDASGRRAFLHDATCTRVDFDPVAERLHLRFAFDGVVSVEDRLTDADVVLTFEEVRVLSAAHDGPPIPEEHRRARGQVQALDHVGAGRFDLQLIDLRLEFGATRVSYVVESH